MNILAIVTSSHRQVERLPEGRVRELTQGLPRTLNSKDRVWYYADTPENREALVRYRIHKRLSVAALDERGPVSRAWKENMKSNSDLGYSRIARFGNYEVGQKGADKFRAYGYEWDSQQDASREMAHHEVCGRGATADEAIDKMVESAIISGQTIEHVHNMAEVNGLSRDEAETLRRELKEALAEMADAFGGGDLRL